MRGFFFTLSAFIVLLYISLIASLQTSALVEMAKSYGEVGDLYTFSAFISSFGEEQLSRVVASLAYYALNRMAEHSVRYPLYAAGEDGTAYAKEALLSLIREGKSDKFEVPLVYNESERVATLQGLVERYNEILSSTPYRVESMDVDLLNLSFVDAFHLNLSVELTVNISSPRGGVSYTTITSAIVPLQGLPDPLVNRFSKGFREIWPYNASTYRLGEVPKPVAIAPMPQVGQGWFYGPVVTVDEANNTPEEERWKYALVGSLEEISSYNYRNQFGAYVVIGSLSSTDEDGDGCREEVGTFNPIDPSYDPASGECLEERGTPGTDKPYVVISSLPQLPREGYFGKEVIFFSSDAPAGREHYLDKYEVRGLYNIEMVRDAVNCQAYFSSKESNVEAPNFFQRMLEKPWEYVDGENGIFSFLVGTEFEDGYPAIDFLYAKALEEGCGRTYYIEGLAGAKSSSMVEGYTMVNKFALPRDIARRLGWEPLIGPEACRGEERVE